REASPTSRLELRHVLGVLIRFADKVADLLGIGRLNILDGLEDREAFLVVDLRKVHRVDDMMALGIERNLAFRRVEGETALQSGNDLVGLQRSRLIGGHCPEMPAIPYRIRRIRYVWIVGAKALMPGGN